MKYESAVNSCFPSLSILSNSVKESIAPAFE